MTCAEYAGDLQQAWVDGAFIDAVMCPYQLQMGEFVFGMFVAVPILLALFVYSNNVALPLTVTLLTGTVVVGMLPSRVHQAAGIIILLSATIAIWLLWHRIQTVT